MHNGVVDMKARKGFVATVFAVLIALLLGVVGMYAISLGDRTSREEARMSLQTQRSYYPIAWSTTKFVLESLKEAYEVNQAGGTPDADVVAIFLSGDINFSPVSPDIIRVPPFTFKVGTGNSAFDVMCNVQVEGRSKALRVKTSVYDATSTYASFDVKGFLSPDHTGTDWTIIWR